jgi:hypothetical protein
MSKEIYQIHHNKAGSKHLLPRLPALHGNEAYGPEP